MSNMKDDIEAAERKLLLFSWVGTILSLGLIVYTFLTFP